MEEKNLGRGCAWEATSGAHRLGGGDLAAVARLGVSARGLFFNFFEEGIGRDTLAVLWGHACTRAIAHCPALANLRLGTTDRDRSPSILYANY